MASTVLRGAVRDFLSRGKFLGKTAVFFVLLFFFERLLFVLFYIPDMYREAGIAESFLAFYKALPLDISAASYFSAIPFLLSLGFIFIKEQKKKAVLERVILRLTLFLAFTTILIQAGETVAYQEWKSKLSSRVFLHMSHPDEVFRTATPGYIAQFIGFALVLFVIAWFLSTKIFRNQINLPRHSIAWPGKLLAFTISLVGYAGLIVIAARGGIGQFPISISNGYFSNHYIVNDASVNTTWNFTHNWLQYRKTNLSKEFEKFPQEEAQAITAELLATGDSTTLKVLKTGQCNVVFVVLESWSAQMIDALGGTGAPNFSREAADGILFENLYSASWTSEKGNASIFSGYPALPRTSINKQDQKIRSLPSLPKSLAQYQTHYYYGGNLAFGHIGGYLLNAGFKTIFDEESLAALEPRGRLGAHDGATLSHFFNELSQAPQPFFYTLFTLSTHSPYDFPGNTGWQNGGEFAAYSKSIAYADTQLGMFFEKARSSPFFDNTLFVFVADHGRTNEFNPYPYNDKMYHIPMLWWGGAIKDEFKGMRVEKIGSQYDLAKTLCVQLSRNADSYQFGKDLFNGGTKDFAMYVHHKGFGWVDTEGYFSFDLDRNKVNESSYQSEEAFNSAFKKCRSFISTIYRDFHEQ